MITIYTRMASLVLAFGFFFGCSVSKNTFDKAPTAASDKLSEAQLEQRISAIDKQLESAPANSALYYEKGSLLIRWAQAKEQPSRRTPLYSKAEIILQKADSLFESRPVARLDTQHYYKLQKIAWSEEHNQGIQASKNASSSEDYRQAALYFNNAIAIMPDSLISYKLGSRMYYKGNEPRRAITVLEYARQNVTPLPVDLLESLAYLYVETEQLAKAIQTYEEARARHRHSFNLMHGLSNAYIEAGNHHNAIQLLLQLHNRKPGNTKYQYSLASEFYKAGREQVIAMVTELEEKDNFNTAVFSTADSLFGRAEHHYRQILNRQPNNAQVLYKTAQFYQNRAAQYQRLLPHLRDENEADIRRMIQQSISSSVPLLEQLSRQKPSKRLWEYLYRTYSYLGMKTKAEEAKANF
ncbi:tetratricopeptide repeat protein [Fodinibius sediminis]|uniref:Uncharacterized protein n=1 Tax=Fodinibius sediminis TaxID=1214077 RepID=A0A521DSF9_9BACT|nr:tetratricopeptide repeat protein [Fodinibius sediminis]SMO74637.1 hypothetical protein SAMN06265218_111111 [Fodinibius sediminis]